MRALLFLILFCYCSALFAHAPAVVARKRIPQSTNTGASAKPEALKITNITKSGGGVAITWEAPAVDQDGVAISVANYRVYRGIFQPNNVAERLIAIVNSPTVTYTDTAALTQINGHDVNYFWRVYACTDKNACSYWKRPPKDHSNKIQWTTTGTLSDGRFTLSRRDYPGDVVTCWPTPTGFCNFDTDNFITGAADQNTALLLRYRRGNDYIEQAYTLADATIDSVNTPSNGTKVSPPTPGAVRTDNNVALSWSAAGGSISGYKAYRNGSLIAETTNLSTSDDISSIVSALHACENSTVYYLLKVLFTDGTLSTGTGASIFLMDGTVTSFSASTSDWQTAHLTWSPALEASATIHITRINWVQGAPGSYSLVQTLTDLPGNTTSYDADVSDIPLSVPYERHVYWWMTVENENSASCTGPTSNRLTHGDLP